MKISVIGSDAECAAALTALRLSGLVDVRDMSLRLDRADARRLTLDLDVQLPVTPARETSL